MAASIRVLQDGRSSICLTGRRANPREGPGLVKRVKPLKILAGDRGQIGPRHTSTTKIVANVLIKVISSYCMNHREAALARKNSWCVGDTALALTRVEFIPLEQQHKRVEPCKNQSRIFGSGLLPL